VPWEDISMIQWAQSEGNNYAFLENRRVLQGGNVGIDSEVRVYQVVSDVILYVCVGERGVLEFEFSLTLGRQVLYHLSHVPALFVLITFQIGFLLVWIMILLFTPPVGSGMISTHH
jgi:hypothetical protein